MTIQFPNLQGRQTWIETSTNLLNWSLWNVPGNDGAPVPSGGTRSITAPVDLPQRYFRLKVQEQ